MRRLFLILLVLLIPTTLVSADPGVVVPWEIDCGNLNRYDGHYDEFGNCVPGLITDKAYYHPSPSTFYGLGDTYAPGVMEWMCERYDDCQGYLDGIALMTCGDIGKTAWLKRPDHKWSGPYLVVDCSHRRHLWNNIVNLGLVVEWGYKTTERWGTPVVQGIAVHIGSKPRGGDRGINYRWWWMEYIADFEVVDLNPPPLYIGIRYILLLP